MLDHGEKKCLKSMPREENGEKGNAQYGLWLRGELGRRANKDWGDEPTKKMIVRMKGMG